MTEAKHPAQLLFTEKHPLTAEIGMEFFVEGEHNLRVELIAPESFTGDDGVHLHTGFSTLLLDTVLGSCAIGNLKQMQPIATIKLTCNHLRQVKSGVALVCNAVWNGEENTISYVSGEIREKETGTLLSNAIGTFMVGTASRPLSEKT